MHSFKTNSSKNLNKIIGNYDFSHIEGANAHSRLHEEIDKQVIRSRQKYGHRTTIQFKWKKSYYDHVVRGKNDLESRIKYIRRNPQKHGLVEKDVDKYKYFYVNKKRIW